MPARYEPEDLVVALLAKLREKNLDRFEANPIRVHPAFFAWRHSPAYGKFLAQFAFDTRDYFPFSETLEEVLDSLQFAGYLERTNPRGTWYQITPALQRVFTEDIAARFEPEDMVLLGRLADEFANHVSTVGTRG